MGLFSFLGSLLGLNSGYGGPQKINILKNATSEGLPIIYGTRRVSPVNVFKIVSRDNASIPDTGHGFDDIKSYGPDDGSEKRQDEYKWLHRIGVWGQGEITGIEHYWVDGDSYQNRRFASKPFFRAATKFGREFQSAIPYLSTASGGKWGADQVGREIAYSWLRFFNSEEDPQYNADPRVEARLRGLKIWDPRTHPNDPDEKSYSANRALVLLDYLMGDYGAGLRLNQIDLNTFITAADICDQGQTIPARPVNTTSVAIRDWDYDRAMEVWVDPGHPLVSMHPYQTSTSIPQYQCHAIIDPSQDVISNIKLLLKGMGWYMPWSNGKLKLIIEQAVGAPAMVFGEDDILGGWSITRGGRDNRLNRVTVDFPNANKDYENDTASWPAFNSDDHKALKAEDQGQDLHETVSLKTITNHYVAQTYAQYLVRKSRAAMRIDGLQLSPAALALEPGDVIGLNESHQNFFYNVTDPGDPVQESLRDTGRWFIVEKVSISPTLDVTVSLIDYDSKVYGLDDPDDEPLRTYDGNPNLLAKPPAVKNLNAVEHTETVTSGIVYSAAFVTWEKPDLSSSALSEIILAWREIPETGEPGDFMQQMRLSPETTSAYISGLYDDRQYEIRVTYTTLLGRVSEAATFLLDLSAQEGQTIVIVGEGAPAPDLGQDGWRYIDMAEGDSFGTVWQKSNGVWADTGNNIKGGDGDRWHSGASNPNDITVSDATAGDFYIRDNGDVFQLLPSGGWDFRTNVQGPQGEDGDQGPRGIAGPTGDDGQTLYLWIGYAPNADGSGMTTGNPRSTDRYFGTAPNRTSPTEQATPSLYTWKEMPAGMTEQEIVDALGWGQNAVDEDHILDDATSEIEKGDGNSSPNVSFTSGGTQSVFLCKVSVKRDPRGILVYGVVALRTTDGSKQDVWLKVHRNGGPAQVGAANLAKISIDPFWRNQSLFFLDKGFAASGSTVEYQLWLGWGGNDVTFQVGQPNSVSAWVQKK